MTNFRKPIDLTTMNWNLNGKLNAKIIVALSLRSQRETKYFLYWLKSFAAATCFKTKILKTTHHNYYGWRSSNKKKQTISAFKIIVNQAFVTCYLAKSIWKISANVNNYKTKLTE